MKHLHVKQWSRSKEQRLNNRYSESSSVWNEGNLEPSNFCSDKVNARKKQQHFAFSPFEYLFNLLPLIIPMRETQKTPKMPMSEAVMLWTSLSCVLRGKLTIFQLLKAPFTGTFLVTLEALKILPQWHNNEILRFQFIFQSHVWAWKGTSIQAITTTSMIKITQPTPSSTNTLRRLSWILTHVRITLILQQTCAYFLHSTSKDW